MKKVLAYAVVGLMIAACGRGVNPMKQGGQPVDQFVVADSKAILGEWGSSHDIVFIRENGIIQHVKCDPQTEHTKIIKGTTYYQYQLISGKKMVVTELSKDKKPLAETTRTLKYDLTNNDLTIHEFQKAALRGALVKLPLKVKR